MKNLLTILSLLILTLVLTSCGSHEDKKNFEHNYLKYWDKYSEKQLIDTLFPDTLMVGPDTEGGYSTREFYINETKELLADLNDDKDKIDSLYPMTAFDELTIRKLPIGFERTLTGEQTERFLEIVNDPVSFNWSETTYESEYIVCFLKDNEVVSSLTIGADKQVIKTEPFWPSFKKMKLGMLKSEPHEKMAKLLKEVE